MAERPSDRSGLPNASDLHREYKQVVDELRECAESLVKGAQPADVALSRNKMPQDHLYIANLEAALTKAKNHHRDAGAILEDIGDRLVKHKIARGTPSE